jgi:hypothetical protein
MIYTFLIRIVGGGGGVQLGPLGTSAIYWPIVPAPGDYDDGEFGGMKIGTGNRSTRRKPAPAPLCPPQIPLDQTRARTRAAAVGSQRLTAWAMAPPAFTVTVNLSLSWIYYAVECLECAYEPDIYAFFPSLLICMIVLAL